MKMQTIHSEEMLYRIRNRISKQALMMYVISADFAAFENQEKL